MNRLGKRLLVLAGVTLIAITLAILGSGSAVARGGLGDGTAPQLEGTWRTTVEVYGFPGGDPPPLEGVLHTFARGGGVLISVPIAGQMTAHGAWTQLGPRRFGFTVEAFWVDAVTGQLGKTKIKEVIEVNDRGDEYRSVESSAADSSPDGRTVSFCREPTVNA